MRTLSEGKNRVEVEGTNVKQIIENLDLMYPGFSGRLLEDFKIKPSISIAVDGEITPMGLIEKVSENSEVHFLPAISGG